MISAAFPYQKQRRRVLGRQMAYVEVGEGDPIVLMLPIRSPQRRNWGSLHMEKAHASTGTI